MIFTSNSLRTIFTLMVGLLLFILVPLTSLAQFNPEINYQGKLTNASGVAVPDGLYNMNFWLVPTQGGATSTAIWSEVRTSSNRVQVQNGLFSVMLGDISSLSSVNFNQTLYLGVEVGGVSTTTPAWDGEMSPRKILGAVPAAFVANYAATAGSASSSLTLGGVASSSFLRSDEADIMQATSSSPILSIIQNGAGAVARFFSGVTEVFTILGNGNVGVGTSTPSTRFTVAGDARITGTSTLATTSISSLSLGTALTAANGGTGLTSVTQNQLLIGGAGNTWTQVATSSLGLGNNTFLGLTDTPGSYTANRIMFTNSAATALTDSANFTFDGVNLGLGAQSRIAFGGTNYLYASSTNDSIAFGESAGAAFTNLTEYNIALGYQAGQSVSTTSADFNSFIGYRAGRNNTGQTNNIFGFNAGFSNTGSNNNLLGQNSGFLNTGSNNNSIGFDAGYQTTGSNNNSFGLQAGYLNAGSNNNLLGGGAGYSNTGSDNNMFGQFSGLLNTGSNNNIFGQGAGRNNTGSSTNLFGFYAGANNAGDYVNLFGENAGRNNSGDYNNFIGYSAGATSTGEYNVAIGYFAGASSTDDSNNFIGRQAGRYSVGNSNNIFGQIAGDNNTGSTNNIFGSGTARNNTGSNNNILGYEAGYNNTGDNNNFLGNSSGFQNIGQQNNFIGALSGFNNTGTGNSFIGYAAGYNNTGDFNEMIGYDTGYNLRATSSTIIGSEAFRGGADFDTPFSAVNNVALGYRAGYNATTSADNNILLGYRAADNLTTGNNNIIIGYDIDNVTATTDNSLNIGNLIFGTGLDGTGTTLASGNVGIGSTTPSAKLTVAGNTYIGGDLRLTGALRDGANASGTIGMILQTTGTSTRWVATSTLGIGGGATTFLALTDTPSSYTANRVMFTNSAANALIDSANFTFDGTNLGLGAQSKIAFGGTNYIYASSTNDSIAFGENAGATFNSGTFGNVAIGFGAGRYASSSNSDTNNFIGLFAGYNNTGANTNILGTSAGYNSTGDRVNLLGYQAGYNNTGSNNNIFGGDTGYNNTGSNNNILGVNAGYNNTGSDNNLFGGRAGQSNTGSYNNIIGSDAGYSNTGSNNNIFGLYAGYKNSGSFNELIGSEAGALLQATATVAIGSGALHGNGTIFDAPFQAINNVAIGYEAGYNATNTADNNILLGYRAADNLTTGNNNIIIGYDIDNVTATADNRLNIGNLIFGTGLDGTGTTLSSGNIGIGTTTPSSKLTVAGDLRLTGAFRDGANASGTIGMILQTTGTSTRWVATSTLGVGGATTFLALTDTPASYTANRIFYTNSLATAVVDSADFTYNGFNLTLGVDDGIAFGLERMLAASSTLDNLYLGRNAGASVSSTSTNNVFLGSAAGNLSSGSFNNMFGSVAGSQNSGSYNNFMGYYAGQTSIGSNINMFGQYSGYQNTGSANNFVGAFTGVRNTGNFNDFIGYEAGATLQSTATVAIGARALFGATGSPFGSNYQAVNNVAIGYEAGRTATNTADNNILIGYRAADNISTGNNNIVIGYDVDLLTSATDNSLNIGNLIFGTGLDGTGTTLASGNIGIGTTTPSSKLTVAGNTYIGGDLRLVGALRDGANATGTLGMILQSTGTSTRWVATSTLGISGGGGSLFTDGGATTYLTATGDNLAIGTTTASAKLTVDGDITVTGDINLQNDTVLTVAGQSYIHGYTLDNTFGVNQFMGYLAGNFALGSSTNQFLGIDNLGVGRQTLSSLTEGNNNVAVGQAAMQNVTTGSDNVGVGSYALHYNTTGVSNIAIGRSALLDNTIGRYNNALGQGALQNNIDGESNVAVGTFALVNNVSGNANIALGYDALNANATHWGSIAIGNLALVDSQADNNIGVGREVGATITTGGNNTIIGAFSGAGITTGANNTIIGSNVTGLSSSLSNNIIIADGAGNRRINVDANGDVAIGTTSPSARLTVQGLAGSALDVFRVSSSTGATELAVLANGNVEVPGQIISAGVEWTLRSGAGDDDSWRAITHGNGLFVAVAEDTDRVMTSPDGINWTARSAAGNNDRWYGVTYGNGLFVAVGDSGDRVMTSSDGINWTARSAAGNNDTWYSVTYANGLFVAVGDAAGSGDAVMTSPDGINWTARSAAANDDTWHSVTYGNGLFVAVGTFFITGDTVMTSPDGITWTVRSAAGNNDGWKSVTYGNGVFVAVGNSGDRVMTSTNGTTWTVRSAAGNNDGWQSVTYGDRLFVAVGNSGDRVMTSPDGINWTVRSATGDNDSWFGIAYGNGLFAAVGTFLFNDVIMTSGKTEINALATNNILQGGLTIFEGLRLSTTTTQARLGIENLNFSSTSTVAGIDQYFSFSNTSSGAALFGNRSYLYASNTATTTMVGSIFRLEDSTTFGNTVRGLEVQVDRGNNTRGENTALSGFARTFGVRGTTAGDAGATFEPAGVYGETQGTTQGNAIRGYSSTITTAALLKLFQDTSAYTGTGLLMNFGNGTGSFSSTTASKFIDLQNAGSSLFTVGAYGMTTIGNGTTINNAGLQIGYGGICVDNDGSCSASTTGRISAVSYHTGNSDLAEMYFSSEDLKTGEVVYLKNGLSIGRATEATEDKIIGVVTTKAGLLLGFDDSSLRSGEEGFGVALAGRVPVRLSNENGEIKAGDELMLSSVPGVAMKASSTGAVVGIALEDFNENRAYSNTYINQFGDDLVDPVVTPINRDSDPRINDGCYYGAGSASGEAPCVPLTSSTADGRAAEAQALAEAEAQAAALADLANIPSEDVTLSDGREVQVGQIVMFVNLEDRELDENGKAMIAALVANAPDINGDLTEETVWSRLVTLANNFVEGVLSVFTLKADRVEVKDEICVDGVCLNADDLRQLLNGQAAPQEPTPEPEVEGEPEPTPEPDVEEPTTEPTIPTQEPVVEGESDTQDDVPQSVEEESSESTGEQTTETADEVPVVVTDEEPEVQETQPEPSEPEPAPSTP